MKYIQVVLAFMQVKVSDAGDILRWMEALAQRGAVFWKADQSQELPHETWKAIVTDEIEQGLKRWERYKRTKPDSLRNISKWEVDFRIHFDDLPDLFPYFGVDQFDERRNHLKIGSLVEFEFKDQRHLVEPLMQRLVELGRLLYPLVRPQYGYLDEAYTNPMLSEDALKLRLKHISWVNFFGPAYVEKYGRDFLLGLPGYKTERLPDGGVFHQLSPTFVAPSEAEARRLRQQVIAYCARHGLKVTCHAPFVIPGLTQRKPAQGLPKDEMEALLAYILTGTTLMLKDGTRVHVLRIPWDDLTEEQRERVLATIRQAAVQAIKAAGGARVRFEFNAVPDDLDALLRDLAGPENPRLEWVEVPDMA